MDPRLSIAPNLQKKPQERQDRVSSDGLAEVAGPEPVECQDDEAPDEARIHAPRGFPGALHQSNSDSSQYRPLTLPHQKAGKSSRHATLRRPMAEKNSRPVTLRNHVGHRSSIRFESQTDVDHHRYAARPNPHVMHHHQKAGSCCRHGYPNPTDDLNWTREGPSETTNGQTTCCHHFQSVHLDLMAFRMA